jgi:hypothetical protein
MLVIAMTYKTLNLDTGVSQVSRHLARFPHGALQSSL